MTDQCWYLLTCPVCGEFLSDTGPSLRCGRGHVFDRAREGYVNLLVPGHGQSNVQGDTPEMLRARRRIFDRSYFEPLSARINSIAAELLAEAQQPVRVVDVGCGEGYYIARLSRSLTDRGLTELCAFGMDVSKHAARLAARAYRWVVFFVGDVRHRIELGDDSVDLLLDVFAPRNPLEFERVLRRDASLLVVLPREEHMIELRTPLDLLHIDADKEDGVITLLQGRFDLVTRDVLEYTVDIENRDVLDFIMMTPNYWHLDASMTERAAALEVTQLTMATTLLRLQPTRKWS